MRFGDMKIPAKLTTVFVALLATIALMGAVASVNIAAHERSVVRMAEAHGALLAADAVQYGLTRQENSLRGFLLSGDPYYLRRIREVHRPKFEAALADLLRLSAHDPNAAVHASAIEDAYAEYRRRVMEPVARLGADQTARTAAFHLVAPDGVADRAIKPAEAAIAQAMMQARSRISAEQAVQARAQSMLRLIMAAGILVTGLITLLAAVSLSRSIARPVGRLAAAMDRVRAGHGFDAKVEPVGKDEIGRLTTAFNEMVADLRWHDASLRHALAELTEARDAAQASDRLKSQFMANMSHELRTPLNGVLGMVQVIQLDDLSAGQRDRMSVVQQSAEALTAIVDDILDLSRIEAGRVELEIQPFCLEGVFDNLTRLYAPRAEDKGLAFKARVDPEAAGPWLGDAARIGQVLANLASNAVKFTTEGMVCIRAGLTDAGLRVTVWDTGVGIPAERQAELFRKFTQLDGSATRKFGGTGLGLAICRELATLMGGEIMVESVEGEGARFTLDLPLERAASEQLQAA